MKKWILHILLFASLFGMLTTSCCQDEEVLQAGETSSGTVRIQFSLDMNGNSGSRAAAWGDITGDATDDNETEDTVDDDIRKSGSEYENTINPNQVQVFLYQGNKFLGEVGGLNLVNTNNANKNIYTFTGEVTIQNATVTSGVLKDATIMVVANYDNYVNGNLALNQDYMFDYTIGAYSANATNKKYIPMWGRLNTDIPLNESATSTIGNIYMLRAMSKIEVVFDESNTNLSEYTIEAAGLSRYNSKGNLFPKSTYMSLNTTGIDTEACFNPTHFNNIISYNINESGLPFEVIQNANGKKRSCIIYVPEYDYTNEASELSIYLSLKRGDQLLTSLDFPNSSGAISMGARDLVRNHWYKYIIENIAIDIEVTFELSYQIINWADITNDSLDFGYSNGDAFNEDE
jgi:hypothetical protein